MARKILDANNIEVCYHTREGVLPALRDINFEVNKGEIIGVVGESGCGKSTLAFTINDLLPPNAEITKGSISFNGEVVLSKDMSRMSDFWGNEFSMIFQDPTASLNPVFTVEQQIMNALRAQSNKTGEKESELRSRMFKMLERVGIADAERRLKEYPHQFSGGMKQRIMIAIALLSRPSFLIADEPTSALDVTLEAQINDLILKLIKEMGTSVLYITHNLGVVAQMCDKVMVMYAGNIVEFGDVYDIFENPMHPYTQALLKAHPSQENRSKRLYTVPGQVPSLRELPTGCKFAPRCEYKEDICIKQEAEEYRIGEHRVLCHFALEDRISKEMEADLANYSDQFQQKDSADEEEFIVSVKDLKVYFKQKGSLLDKLKGKKENDIRAVNGVDLEIAKGEILAIVGESGSGKTTTGRSVLRLNKPTSGKIVVDGIDITDLSLKEIRPMRLNIQMIFQDAISSLSPRMTVESLLLEPFTIHNKKIDNPKQKAQELLEMVGLSMEQADKYPHQLSGGQARRISIARALALNPDILVADEPTAGLDVSVAAGILNLLKDLRDRLNLTYIIITHDLNVISYIADRVAVMYLGKFVELADTDELLKGSKHPYTQALLSAVSLPDPTLRDKSQRIILDGEAPNPRDIPVGCSFNIRCNYSEDICRKEEPELKEVNDSSHLSACHFSDRF